MKRKGIIALIIVAAVVLSITIPLTLLLGNNRRISKNLLDDFSDIVSDSIDGKIVEEQEVYGKLNGNGNGFQYFGAVLIKKDAVTDRNTLLAKLNAEFETVGILDQNGQKVVSSRLQHSELTWDTEISGPGQYITIYYYNSSHPDSNPWDIRGY